MPKTVLITGASRGFDRDTAETLASGYRGSASMRDPSGKNREAANSLWSQAIDVVALDVTDDNSVQRAVQAAIDKAGRIDVLVNNAGIASAGMDRGVHPQLLHRNRRLRMTRFTNYHDLFPNARLARSDNGVLEVKLHTNGGKLVFNGYTHEQFVDLFHAIGEDRENRVVILTGSGDAFMDSITQDGFDFFTPLGYDKIYREGRKVLMNILDIEVPMITALNGPVLLHSEYALLTDIVLATPETVFQDFPHPEFGIVPGDGMHLVWPEVIGSIRGRYFLLTQQKLDAETAQEWGVINEIVPADRLLARAHEIADGIAKMPPLTSSYTRIALTQRLRRLIDEGTGHGLALEGISAAEVRGVRRSPREIDGGRRRGHGRAEVRREAVRGSPLRP